MTKRARREHRSRTSLRELVVAAVVDDMEQASEYAALLRNNQIPATVKQRHDELTGRKQFAVMVGDEFADEAGVIIEAQDAYDDFADFGPEEDEEDLAGNAFDDGF